MHLRRVGRDGQVSFATEDRIRLSGRYSSAGRSRLKFRLVTDPASEWSRVRLPTDSTGNASRPVVPGMFEFLLPSHCGSDLRVAPRMLWQANRKVKLHHVSCLSAHNGIPMVPQQTKQDGSRQGKEIVFAYGAMSDRPVTNRQRRRTVRGLSVQLPRSGKLDMARPAACRVPAAISARPGAPQGAKGRSRMEQATGDAQGERSDRFLVRLASWISS